ncbi:uncharacterized protein B0T23DRAFT_378656 [Neurospora hispaniola]|uniref:Uncharacterized protein n=1 Tax=Neurospora hispaniola TaxID=588809 RepID=A0AAJ0MTH5_9PEZI|nr:hypothetical protein B0T23DRAFT_378656 [Neurospora hispaniola]
MPASEQATLANASFRGLPNMMISGQGFFELEACSSTTEAVRRRMAVTAAFAFDHPGPDVDPTYKDRQHYKIEIMWTLNQGINRLNGQQLSTDDISMDDIDVRCTMVNKHPRMDGNRHQRSRQMVWSDQGRNVMTEK